MEGPDAAGTVSIQPDLGSLHWLSPAPFDKIALPFAPHLPQRIEDTE
jgi:hypothetical protein